MTLSGFTNVIWQFVVFHKHSSKSIMMVAHVVVYVLILVFVGSET